MLTENNNLFRYPLNITLWVNYLAKIFWNACNAYKNDWFSTILKTIDSNKEEASSKVYLSFISAKRNQSRLECWLIREQYVEIWIDFHALTWQEIDTFTHGYPLDESI